MKRIPVPKWWQKPPGKLLQSGAAGSGLFQMSTGWYYYDESGKLCFGPFEAKRDAKVSLVYYARSL